MAIISDLQSLSHDAEIELFELTNFINLDDDPLFNWSDQDLYADRIFRFTNVATNLQGTYFGGDRYYPIACEINGISYTSEGSPPRPKLLVSDAASVVSDIIEDFSLLEGSILTIKKTLRRYLDDQPTADSTAFKPVDVYTISHVAKQIPGKVVEFELVSAWDFVEEILPNRRCIRKCPWIYRSASCGYAGNEMYDLNNQPTFDLEQDRCAKTVTACAVHFGKTSVLYHGGYPGLQRF
jgi:lambda family phage minor tail protein L